MAARVRLARSIAASHTAVMKLLFLLFGLAAATQAAEIYEFHLDGKPHEAAILSLNGTPDKPQPGDVARVGRHQFVLDETGLYDLQTDKSGNLWRVRAGGLRELLACKIEQAKKGGGKPASALDDLKPEEKAPLLTYKQMQNCHSLSWHPDGKRLAVAATNGGSNGNGRPVDKDGKYKGNNSPIHVFTFPS